ncbi:ethanolamine ammonia-lyase subunit EutC [Nocardioides sp. GY 10127]|uniref:ethanolamine ammonia-lyase subunit EutC n=1 Tax=Nocardioides sp. GY 10127 TaxID=2569762 RepID=UPI0010A8C4C9|nr:ethanolamine ammonia-lyase subunit EutC [Nocardioides sp. GY 10127]TIC79905.1 ethanolamine ammonia-lyase subunit EutC [Nocardioides sp. GY 10127]
MSGPGDVEGTAQGSGRVATATGTDDFWAPLRGSTRSRIGLGRAGDALPTREVLALRSAHAVARDAVHLPWDADALEAGLAPLGLPVHRVHSAAVDRAEYLRRPDLGRRPVSLDGVPGAAPGSYDVAIVLADGLSARAQDDHGATLTRVLVDSLTAVGLTLAPLVLAEQSRVGLGDHVGAHLGATAVVVVIGERPGLSVADSLGLYLTHRPRPGRRDSERNCISNVHPPDGLSYERAAQVLTALVLGARELGESGVRLKDVGPALSTDDLGLVDPAL